MKIQEWAKLLVFTLIILWMLNTIPYPSIYCDRFEDRCSVYEKTTFALTKNLVYNFKISDISDYKIETKTHRSNHHRYYYYVPILNLNGVEKELYGFNFKTRAKAEDFVYKIQNYDTYKLNGNFIKMFFNMY